MALLALTVQLAVALVHVHIGRAAPGLSQPASILDVRMSARKLATSPSMDDEAPGLVGDYCAICALIHLAGTGISGQPPALTLPIVFGRLRLKTGAESESMAPRRALLQARAPPLA